VTLIDRSWLELVGFPPGLEDTDADRLIVEFNQRLELRVGGVVSAELTDDELDRCSEAIDDGDDELLMALLEEARHLWNP
jgi:hypothetical protein